jgi:hypothetical protein
MEMVRLITVLLLLLSWCQGVNAQAVLNAHPGPFNNGGGMGSALFFDVQASTDLVLTGLTTSSDAIAGATYTLRVYTRPGTAIGGPVDVGPGSSPAGWVLHGSFQATQGAADISLPIALPPIRLPANRTVGVALEFVDITSNYFGTASAPIEVYANSQLTLTTGAARSVPFTTGGSYFQSRALVGSILYRLADPQLPAKEGPPNNQGGIDSGMFLNLQSTTGAVITELVTGNQAPPDGSFNIDVYTRSGTALGNSVGAGPGSSSAGWTLRGNAAAVQGEGLVSRPIVVPELFVPPGETLGVALVFRAAGPRYFGTGTSPLLQYGTPALTVTTGEAMTTPFSASSSVFASRSLVGSFGWRPPGRSLRANNGPSDNSGATGFGMFMDIQALADLRVTGLRASTNAAPLSTFQVAIYSRSGSTLGGSASTGPTSSPAGWTLLTQADAVQGATGTLSLPIAIPALDVAAGQTAGIALVFTNVVPVYRGTGSSAVSTYEDGLMRLVTGESRQLPFTTGGDFFVSRQLIGDIYYTSTDILFSNGFQ